MSEVGSWTGLRLSKSGKSPIVPCVGWGTMGDGGVGAAGEGVNQSHVLFDRFVQATTCKGTLKTFQELCDFLELKPSEYRVFYHKLKSKLNYWKAKALWAKLDKRASHKEYKKGRACANSKVRYEFHKSKSLFVTWIHWYYPALASDQVKGSHTQSHDIMWYGTMQ